MKTEVIRAEHPVALQHAVDILCRGGVVAFPTDTVYGLGALISGPEPIDRLYAAKGRNSDRAIAVLVGDPADLNKVTLGMTRVAEILARRFWPGPMTLVVPGRPNLPPNLSPLPTIGVRMPNHPVALALLRQTGPLAVTSANLSGRENTNTAQEVLWQLEGRIHLVIDGGVTPGGVPSTVVDCTGDLPAVLRTGPITLEQLLGALRSSAAES